jgi:hypothetical protein
MENVLADMVQRLREIELLLRTQNELLTRVLTELEQIRRSPNADKEIGSRVVSAAPDQHSSHA